MWVLAGTAAFALFRLVRSARAGWLSEGVLALVSGAAAGLAATALDFGGWKEPDWRAGAFAFAVAAAAIGAHRLIRLLWR